MKKNIGNVIGFSILGAMAYGYIVHPIYTFLICACVYGTVTGFKRIKKHWA